MLRKFIACIFIISAINVSGQTRLENPEMYVGASAGATGSMIFFNPTVAQTYSQGYTGGLMFRYIAEKNVGVQAELNFSQAGWKEAEFSRQLNYIELPFLTHIYIGKKTRFIINAGPKVAYLLSNRVVTNSSTSTDIRITSSPENAFDYGLCAGLGLQFKAGKNNFELETRGYYALSSIYNNSKKDTYANSNNINVAVKLGWMFQIK